MKINVECIKCKKRFWYNWDTFYNFDDSDLECKTCRDKFNQEYKEFEKRQTETLLKKREQERQKMRNTGTL